MEKMKVMRAYEVYYAVDLSAWITALPTIAGLSETHRLVSRVAFAGESEADNMESVMSAMQGEVWSPNGEKREYIKGLGLRHTSCSIGDVIRSLATGKYYAVVWVGFAELK